MNFELSTCFLFCFLIFENSYTIKFTKHYPTHLNEINVDIQSIIESIEPTVLRRMPFKMISLPKDIFHKYKCEPVKIKWKYRRIFQY